MSLVRLWRRRVLVLVALLLACVVGLGITYRIGFPPTLSSRQHQVGIATASALVDSARSQVADLVGASGGDTTALAYRASLLASLMTSSPIKDDIARRAGIPTADLLTTGPSTVVGSDSPAPLVANATTGVLSPRASTLKASVPTLAAGQLPVIQVNTQAPTPAIAARLANAAFAALKADVDGVAAADKIPTLQRLVIRSLGPAAAAASDQGPGPLLGLAGGVVTFLLACAGILGLGSTRPAEGDALALYADWLDPREVYLPPAGDDPDASAGPAGFDAMDSASGGAVRDHHNGGRVLGAGSAEQRLSDLQRSS